jgi:hypothetical protein
MSVSGSSVTCWATTSLEGSLKLRLSHTSEHHSRCGLHLHDLREEGGGLTEGLADDGGGERGHRALRKRVLQSSAMSRVGFGGPPSPVFAPMAAVVLSEA